MNYEPYFINEIYPNPSYNENYFKSKSGRTGKDYYFDQNSGQEFEVQTEFIDYTTPSTIGEPSLLTQDSSSFSSNNSSKPTSTSYRKSYITQSSYTEGTRYSNVSSNSKEINSHNVNFGLSKSPERTYLPRNKFESSNPLDTELKPQQPKKMQSKSQVYPPGCSPQHQLHTQYQQAQIQQQYYQRPVAQQQAQQSYYQQAVVQPQVQQSYPQQTVAQPQVQQLYSQQTVVQPQVQQSYPQQTVAQPQVQQLYSQQPLVQPQTYLSQQQTSMQLRYYQQPQQTCMPYMQIQPKQTCMPYMQNQPQQTCMPFMQSNPTMIPMFQEMPNQLEEFQFIKNETIYINRDFEDQIGVSIPAVAPPAVAPPAVAPPAVACPAVAPPAVFESFPVPCEKNFIYNTVPFVGEIPQRRNKIEPTGPPVPTILPTIYRTLRRNDDYDDYNEPMYRCEDRPNYDELSREMWSDFFYDQRMQNVRENEYDYGFSEDFVNQNCDSRKNGKFWNVQNNTGRYETGPIENKNKILSEAAIISKNFSSQNPPVQNWPLDSKNIF